jgi:squalene-associated FAD-dependent desaturase
MRQSESSLSTITAAAWLNRHRQDANLREKFWDVILVSALGDIPERVSMAAARKVIADGFAGAQTASDVWVPNRPLSEIFSGSMLEFLRETRIDARSGIAVKSIQHANGSIKLHSHDNTFEVDHVVLATGWRAASNLIDSIDLSSDWKSAQWKSETFRFLSEVKSSPITGLHLWFDRSLTEHAHVVMVGTTSQWLFRQPLREIDQPNSQSTNRGTNQGIYHQVVISGVHQFSNAPKEALLSQVLDELRDAFPDKFSGDDRAKLLHHRIVTDPNAVYSVTPEFQAARPAAATPVNWLTLAGDYVQTGWPATMEGATISGNLAADDVLHRCWSVEDANGCSCLVPPLKRSWLAKWLIRDG